MTLQLSNLTDNKVINLIEFRNSRKLQAQETVEKVKVLKRVYKERRQSRSAKFNYEFYCLVDLFMREHYPDYAWRFDVWMNKIEKESNDNT